MVLLQTLVISVIISMIAVMVLKVVLARHMLAARNYRSTVSQVHAQGYAMQCFSAWNFDLSAVPASGSTEMDSKTVRFTTSGPSSMRTIVYTVDEDE